MSRTATWMWDSLRILAPGKVGGPAQKTSRTVWRRICATLSRRLCRAVLGVFVRALLGFEQRRARALGIRGRAGAVTAIQRCGSALNTNPHFGASLPRTRMRMENRKQGTENGK
jgi:hypothetical protein